MTNTIIDKPTELAKKIVGIINEEIGEDVVDRNRYIKVVVEVVTALLKIR